MSALPHCFLSDCTFVKAYLLVVLADPFPQIVGASNHRPAQRPDAGTGRDLPRQRDGISPRRRRTAAPAYRRHRIPPPCPTVPACPPGWHVPRLAAVTPPARTRGTPPGNRYPLPLRSVASTPAAPAPPPSACR